MQDFNGCQLKLKRYLELVASYYILPDPLKRKDEDSSAPLYPHLFATTRTYHDS